MISQGYAEEKRILAHQKRYYTLSVRQPK